MKIASVGVNLAVMDIQGLTLPGEVDSTQPAQYSVRGASAGFEEVTMHRYWKEGLKEALRSEPNILLIDTRCCTPELRKTLKSDAMATTIVIVEVLRHSKRIGRISKGIDCVLQYTNEGSIVYYLRANQKRAKGLFSPLEPNGSFCVVTPGAVKGEMVRAFDCEVLLQFARHLQGETETAAAALPEEEERVSLLM